jgi:EAL domain-containing protein (putative c-di-GMP-specific phosphodiesterase class I)
MYEAKASGKRQAVYFDPEMSQRVDERLLLEQDLRAALENKRLTVAYQPIFDLQNQTITEVEALARWIHDSLGSIPPDKFIRIAEESGLILELGRWILLEACAEATRWTTADTGPSVAVNVSQYQLHNTDLLTLIDEALETTGLHPKRLKLEITESVMMHDPRRVISLMHEIRARGVRLAIDDFGTGYSSMSMLRDLPVDAIKIDRSFVNRLTEGAEEDEAIIRAILGLSKSLNLYVVSEGIETKAQMNFLAAEGCELGQGYLYAKPMTPEGIREMVQKSEEGKAA